MELSGDKGRVSARDDSQLRAQRCCRECLPCSAASCPQNGCAFNGAFPFREVPEGGGLDVTLYRTLSTRESLWGFAVYIS